MISPTVEHEPLTRRPAPRVGFRQVLSNRSFFALWSAQVISSLGSWLMLFALLSFAGFNLKIGSSQLGGMAAGFLLTQAVVLPFAGVLIDRLNLKKTLIACDLTRAAFVLLLLLISHPAHLYPLILVLSAVACLFMSGQLASLPRIVRKEELIVANSLTTQIYQLNAVLAPIVAGAIITRFGPRACFVINSLTFLFSASCLSFVRMKEDPSGLTDEEARAKSGSPRPTLKGITRELLAGGRFVAKNKMVRFVVVSAAMTILAAGWIHTLGVIYVRDVLMAGPKTLGVLFSSLGGGAMVGLFLIGKLGQNASRLKMIITGTLAIGVGITLLTLVSRPAEAYVIVFLLGVAAIAVLIPSQTLVQEQTPTALLGRVGGVSWSLILLSQAVSVSLAGAAADWMGIKSLYRFASLILMLTAATGLLWRRAGQGSPSRLR